jgi:hypothetical protein
MSGGRDEVTGGCRCGAVRFAIARPAEPATACHCESCRRVTSSPWVPWVTTRALRWTGEPPRKFESSPGVTRTFCPTCGSPLTYTSVKEGGDIDVLVCCLDEPEAWPPVAHIWCVVLIRQFICTHLRITFASWPHLHAARTPCPCLLVCACRMEDCLPWDVPRDGLPTYGEHASRPRSLLPQCPPSTSHHCAPH